MTPQEVLQQHIDEILAYVPVKTTNVTTAAELNSAIAAAIPGELIVIKEGIYDGIFHPVQPGQVGKPIVLKGEGNARILGAVNLQKDSTHNPAFWWVTGLDVSDPNEINTQASVLLEAEGVKAFNNVFHDPSPNAADNATQSFGAGKGAFIYGNIIYQGRHNLYTQNTFETHGYKVIANNLFLDPIVKAGAADPYTFHAYGSSGTKLTGYYLKDNTFEGRFIMGGSGTPGIQVENEVVEDNEFTPHSTGNSVQFGYNGGGPDCVAQAVIQRNFFNKMVCAIEWTNGKEDPLQSALQMIVTDNILKSPTGTLKTIRLSTSCSDPDSSIGKGLGFYNFRTDLLVDRNKYETGFLFYMKSNKVDRSGNGLTKLRTNSTAAGCPMEQNGSEAPASTAPRITLRPNALDPNRFHLVIYNYTGAATVNVPNLPEGGQVYNYNDTWGTPLDVVDGNVPTPKEFNAYLVKVPAPTTCEDQLAAAQAQIASLTAQVAALTASVALLESENQTLNNTIIDLNTQIMELQNQITLLQGKIDQVKAIVC